MGATPVEGAQVMLFEKPRDHEPGAKIVQVESAMTDDTGTYEFDSLAKRGISVGGKSGTLVRDACGRRTTRDIQSRARCGLPDYVLRLDDG